MKWPSHHPGTVNLNSGTARSQPVISHLLPKTLLMSVCKLATYKPDMKLRPCLALSLHTPICSTDFLYQHWLDSGTHTGLWLSWLMATGSQFYKAVSTIILTRNYSMLSLSTMDVCLYPTSNFYIHILIIGCDGAFLSPTQNVICGLMLIQSTNSSQICKS